MMHFLLTKGRGYIVCASLFIYFFVANSSCYDARLKGCVTICL